MTGQELPYEYVGGGYFRKKGIPKGEIAEIIHAPIMVELLIVARKKAVSCLEKIKAHPNMAKETREFIINSTLRQIEKP